MTRVLRLAWALACALLLAGAVRSAERLETPAVRRAVATAVCRSVDSLVKALTAAGRDTLRLRMSLSRLSSDCAVIDFRVEGEVRLKARDARHPVLGRLTDPTPLPMTPLFTGFLTVTPPADAAEAEDERPVSVGMLVEFQVRVDSCVSLLRDRAVSNILAGPEAAWKAPLAAMARTIDSGALRPVLEKLFPEVFEMGVSSAIEQGLNRTFKLGRLSPEATVTASGVGDLVRLGICLGVRVLLSVISSPTALGAVAGAPVTLATDAVKAYLAVLTLGRNGVLATSPLALLDEGWYRDHFARIDGHLVGTYLPGGSHVRWLEDRVSQEASRDEYGTVHRLLFFLSSMEPLRRGFWQPVVARLRPTLEERIRGGSWLARRYLTLIDLLLEAPGR